MNTYCSGRSSRLSRLFSFGLLDGLQVRLRRPHLREAPAVLRSLSRFATAFMKNPGYLLLGRLEHDIKRPVFAKHAKQHRVSSLGFGNGRGKFT